MDIGRPVEIVLIPEPQSVPDLPAPAPAPPRRESVPA